MIILEGMDSTGKTTLIHKLASGFNLPIIKSYKPKNMDDIKEFHAYAIMSPRTPLLDRHPAISDLVYGPICRGQTPSSIELAIHCTENKFLVYCDPGYSAILDTLNNEEQMVGVHTHSHELYQSYHELMEQLSPNFIYDWRNPRSLSALITNLTHYLARKL
jgi:hypothetical protein